MIAILDYDAGNLTSVERAVRHLGFDCAVTSDLDRIAAADRIIFPGVGAAGAGMESLARRGLDVALSRAVGQGKPVLGICLGTQIILAESQENDAQCLGLLAGRVLAFDHGMEENGERLKVPHMGWNNVEVLSDHPVLADIRPGHQFYFVHSYYPMPENESEVLGRTRYGISFPSVIGRDNLVATQFHPEKSGPPGLALLRNFCVWNL